MSNKTGTEVMFDVYNKFETIKQQIIKEALTEANAEIDRLRRELESAWNNCPHWYVEARKAALGEG